jgi:hypothetical protein
MPEVDCCKISVDPFGYILNSCAPAKTILLPGSVLMKVCGVIKLYRPLLDKRKGIATLIEVKYSKF